MKVLVTGASGYVGRWTVGPLVEAGFEVHGAARHPGPDARVRWHRADLLADGAAVIRALRPTYLLHCAWTVAHGAFWTDPANERWLEVSLDLVRAFVDTGGARLVTVGSCAERAGEGGSATPYCRAKFELARAVARIANAAHARLFFSFGPDEHRDRLVPSLARGLLAGTPVTVQNGAAVRDYLDVRDIGRALAAILAGGLTGPVEVGGGTGVALADLGARLAAMAGRPDLLQVRPGTADRIIADTARLRASGFQPRIALDQGLADALAWWRDCASAPGR